MTVKKYRNGEGWTERERTRVTLSTPPTAEEVKAIEEALTYHAAMSDPIGRARAFCKELAGEYAQKERQAMKSDDPATLAAVQEGKPEEETPEGVAYAVLRRLDLADAAASRNDMAAVARFTWEAAQLFTFAAIRYRWETHALRGEKIARSAEEGGRIMRERTLGNITPKTEEVLRYVAAGHSYQQAARRFGKTKASVSKLCQRHKDLMEKFKAEL